MDVYIPDAIPSAMVAVHASLRATLEAHPSQAVAFGNTNLNPLHYRAALQLAEELRRPVQVVRWWVPVLPAGLDTLYPPLPLLLS